MSFCGNCGSKLPDEGAHFCPFCGAPIKSSLPACYSGDFDAQQNVEQPEYDCNSDLYADALIEKRKEQSPNGLIFTNSILLSEKFKLPRNFIVSSLNKYIEKVMPYIQYSLLDVSNCLQNNVHGFPLYTQSSQTTNDWRFYHKLLFNEKQHLPQNQIDYLFIIGGEDIIPVPMMSNCMPERMNETVPTDILYGFDIFGFSSSENYLDSLINSNQYYHVGRFPLGKDASFDQLQNYLERAANNMEQGIPIQIAYAQSDPHWKQVSMEVVSNLNKSNLFPDIQAPESVLHKKVFLSPYVTCETIDNAFNTYSSLFYFNMHGSCDPSTPQFLGEAMEERKLYAGIDPITLQEAKFDNIIVTEACYGGKYINLSTAQSMLLSAMSNTTLLYLGSSAIAYGMNDKGLKHGDSFHSADIMAREFISGMMKGFSAGESISNARRLLFNAPKGKWSLSNLLTIFEFSLYGDPALKALFPNRQREAFSIANRRLSDSTENLSLQVDQVFSDNSNSILNRVRAMVDSNIFAIHENIQSQLVKYYGIKPRKLTAINRIKFGSISQHMFSYKTETDSETIVVYDDLDKTFKILISKDSVEQYLNEARMLSIDYSDIFQTFCQRFGLMTLNNDVQPVIEGNGGTIKKVLIDKRIEPKSKKQIITFNALLDQVYRPEMNERNIVSLESKDCDYDFSPLINPLSIILETEISLGLMPLIKKYGNAYPTEPHPTFGQKINCFKQNRQLLNRNGICDEFIFMLEKAVHDYRNPAAHRGGINENKFLNFYKLFLNIISSSVFITVLELKQKQKS